MIRYGKTTQTAISALSRLAEVHAEGRQLSSLEVASDRDLSQTLVAKLLTNLSQAGLVDGARGPGGGYSLARPPAEINLYDIASVFERLEDRMVCPLGPNWCGVEGRGDKEPCPIHDDYVQFTEWFDKWLKETTLAVFCEQEKKKKPRKKKKR